MKKWTFLALAVACAGPAWAQSPKSEKEDDDTTSTVRLKLINTYKSEHQMAELFKRSMSEYFNDPQAPRFLLYDQKHEIAFGVGGYVRLRPAYDFNGSPTNSYGFVTNSIPAPSNPASRSNFNMDASKSTVFFKLLGNNRKLGQFEAYVSGAFTGTNFGFELNDAYVSVKGFLVGRTWSTFNDMAAMPPTIDSQGPSGAAFMRTTQIRYARPFGKKKNWQAALAVEMPQSTETYGTQVGEINQNIPDIPVYLQYSWGKENASHVRLSGVMRNQRYRDLLKEENKTVTSFGGQFSTSVSVNKLLTLYGQVNYGKGITQYINDLAGEGLSLMPDPEKAGKMYAPETLGWLAHAQFNVTESVFLSAGYSQARFYPGDGYDGPDQYRQGQYVVANAFWNLNSMFQLGAEYLWGSRENLDGTRGYANCAQLLLQFNF